MVEKELFRPGDKVLAYHGPLVYEARVLKFHEYGKQFVEICEDKTEPIELNKIPGFLQEVDAYFLHYKGWSSKWDEWVSNERIMEFNDDNLGLSRELRNARKKAIERMDPKSEVNRKPLPVVKEEKKRSRPATASTKTSGEGKSSGRKKPRGDSRNNYELTIPLRPRLKCVLVDDWEYMTRDHKLVDLDHTKPINTILKKYYAQREKTLVDDQMALDVIRETIQGLTLYFNKMLSLDLLYRYERLQYSNLITENPNIDPANVYGLEHLLRLLVVMPAQASQASMDAPSLTILLSQITHLMEYLDDNYENLKSDYMNASPGYDRLAKGT